MIEGRTTAGDTAATTKPIIKAHDQGMPKHPRAMNMQVVASTEHGSNANEKAGPASSRIFAYGHMR